MKKHLKEFFKYASLPIILLGFFGVLVLLYKIFDLPSYAEINAWVKVLFDEHGYSVVFLGALAEGILLANWYLPGSVVVVMGVALAQEAGLSAPLVVSLIILGFLITALFNYALGRYGWYRLLAKFGLQDTLEKIKKRVEKHGLKIIFGTYFHPNVGALTATSAGILRLPFYRFALYSVLALTVWNTFWGFIVYFSGPAIINLVSIKNLLIILSTWVVVLLAFFIWKKKKSMQPANVENASKIVLVKRVEPEKKPVVKLKFLSSKIKS